MMFCAGFVVLGNNNDPKAYKLTYFILIIQKNIIIADNSEFETILKAGMCKLSKK